MNRSENKSKERCQMKKIKSIINRAAITVTVLFSLNALSGCSDDSVAPQADNVDMSVTGSPDTIDNNGGILVLDTVKLLIKDIKLNVASSSQDSTNFKVGPYVLFLDLNSGVNLIGSSYIPAGTYDKVRFMVHKLDDNEIPPDPEFLDPNGRYSVVVKGWFAGIYFVYKSDKSAHQKLTFPGSLQVSTTVKSNITLKVMPYLWFISGGVYLDPAIKANWPIIDTNIKENINNNFKVFVDNDKNGKPD
jgi:hypothetical protein